MALLEVRNLTCTVPTADGEVRLVNDVSFDVERGQTLGVVGESGSGKTMLVRSLLGIGPSATTVTGSVRFDGVELVGLSKNDRRKHLGTGMSMVMQDPMTSLNPMVPIGRQIAESMVQRRGLSRAAARAAALGLLDRVGISEPERRIRQYPFELSGGMRQRVTIAAALAADPTLLVADEATTALDVTVQNQILTLLADIQRERDMAVIMISHDLGVVAGRTDMVAVMYGGELVEHGPTGGVIANYRHRYTEALLAAVPRFGDEPHTPFSTISGSPPTPAVEPVGCRYTPRCARATDECRELTPQWAAAADVADHRYRCHWPTSRSNVPDVDDAQPMPEEVGH